MLVTTFGYSWECAGAVRLWAKDSPDWVITRCWERLAADLGIGFRLIRQTLLDMSGSLSAIAATNARDFQMQHGSCDILDAVLQVIARRCAKVQAMPDV